MARSAEFREFGITNTNNKRMIVAIHCLIRLEVLLGTIKSVMVAGVRLVPRLRGQQENGRDREREDLEKRKRKKIQTQTQQKRGSEKVFSFFVFDFEFF